MALAGMVLAIGCGKGGAHRDEAPAPPAPPPKVVAPAPADAAPDTVTAASDVGVWEDAGPPVETLPEGRALVMKYPLRGGGAARAPVFVARGRAPELALRRAFDQLHVRLPTDRRVVVLVNLGGYDRIKKGADDGVTGRTTDRELVRALITELRRRGVRDLALAAGASSRPKELQRVLAVTGYGPMLDELKVPLIDLNHYGDGDDRPLPWKMVLPWAHYLKKELVLSDDLVDPKRPIYLIDVPKLKAHRFAVMSMSIKNLMGAVMIDDGGSTAPWQRRWRMHRELAPWLAAWKKSKTDDRAAYRRALAVFAERLADLYGALTPDLVILDGYPAMQGDGFARVAPLAGGPYLIASKNGCYADYVGAQLFGLADSDALEAEVGARMPPAIAAVAARYYGGVAALKKITVRGDTDWRAKPMPTAWLVGMAPFTIGKRPDQTMPH